MVRKITFGDNDGGKLFEGFRNHVLDQFLFRFGGWAGGVEKILEGTTFEGEGGKAEDFGKTLVVQGLHDHSNAPSNAKVVGDDVGSTHCGVVPA